MSWRVNPLTKRRCLLVALLSASWGTVLAQPKLLELNQASRAELESLPGLGPSLVDRLLAERAKTPFSDWADVRHRVRGIGPASAKKLSALGLRVNGQAYSN